MSDESGKSKQPDTGVWASAQEAWNPAVLRGTVGVLAGAVVLFLPNVTLAVLELTVGVALAVSSGTDLWYAVAGRGRRKKGSRSLALVRGLSSLLFTVLILFTPRSGLNLLVSLFAIYLGVRGLISIVAALSQGARPGRGARITGGATALAFGVVGYVSPSTTTSGLILTGAVSAIIVGLITLAYGLHLVPGRDRSLDPAVASLSEILSDWVRATDVGDARREELAEGLYFEQPERSAKLVAWSVMLVLSVAIATFAVLQDSTAVVIGAMLIAPLMVPIIGLAGALVNGWRRRAAASLIQVLGGVAASIGVAYGLSTWVAAAVAFDTNSQITSRVNPALLDMLIAVAAGAAGGYATVSKRVAPSIAGVAIAVALVPPLAVVGISLESQRIDAALGAFLLFSTNFVAIVLSASVVFVLGGFAEPEAIRRRPSSLVSTLAPFVALAGVILVPLVFTSEGLLATATQQRQAQIVVSDWLGEDSALRLDRVTVDGDQVEVELTGPEEVPALAPLRASLTEEFGFPVGVVVTLTPVTTAELGPPLSP